MPPLMALTAVPFFLLGLMLVYVVGFSLQWLPIYGGYTAGSIPQWSLAFAIDVVEHAILPALAIILGSIGFWALGMRGDDGHQPRRGPRRLRRGQGLQRRTIFFHYGVRNAMLPQATALASSSANWSPAPSWWRSSSAIPASARCCSRRSRAPISSSSRGSSSS